VVVKDEALEHSIPDPKLREKIREMRKCWMTQETWIAARISEARNNETHRESV
jgi:hypothetical protein